MFKSFAHAAVAICFAASAAGCLSSPSTVDASAGVETQSWSVERIGEGPILSPQTDPSIGHNIQGPSLIRVPDWVSSRLGRYYLYFADHKGAYIRLAYADALEGPWTVYAPGALQLTETQFPHTPPAFTTEQMAAARAQAASFGVDFDQFPDIARELTTPHIASPDVHVDEERRRIVMYYHGLEAFATQVTRAATSTDGIHFTSQAPVLGRTYWRAFSHQRKTYAIAMPGVFYRSDDPLSGFEQGPTLFPPDMRHAAVFQSSGVLNVIWSQVGGEPPERLLLSSIDTTGPWESWKSSPPIELLRPERDWEGADRPLIRSVRSTAPGRVHQLRDPAIYQENGRVYLLYAIAGESGIGLAELKRVRSSALSR